MSAPPIVPPLTVAWPRRALLDARAVRHTLCTANRQQSSSSSDTSGNNHRHELTFYPRSFAYHVSPTGAGTHVHLYGSTPLGETVAVRVTGYRPYMFLRLGPTLPSRAAVEACTGQLNDLLLVMALQYPNASMGRDVRSALKQERSDDDDLVQPITGWECTQAVPLKSTGDDRGFNGGEPEHFLQLYLYAPAMVPVVRKILEFIATSPLYSNLPVMEMTATGRSDFLQKLYTTLTARRKDESGSKKRKAGPSNSSNRPTKVRLAEAAQQAGSLRQLLTMTSSSSSSSSSSSASSQVSSSSQDPVGTDVEESSGGDDVGPWDDANVDIVYIPEPSEEDKNAAFENRHGRVGQAVDRIAERGCHAPLLTLLRVAQAEPASRPTYQVPEVYEADIDFVVRYAIDAGFKAEECVAFTGATHQRQPFAVDKDGNPLGSGNNISFAADWRLFQRVDDQDAQDAIAPQVCLSVDCEMETGPDGRFPQPEIERVLQICCVAFDPVADPKCEHVVRRAFILGDDVALWDPDDVGKDRSWTPDEVYVCRDERTLLTAFGKWTSRVQPDMLTGWNVENFDLWYLLERSKHLQVSVFASLCRLPGMKLRVAERAFHSSAHGTHLYKEVSGEGLWVWDLFQAFKRSTSYKLRSYSLEFVSNTFLGDRKEDVAYSAINGLQQSSIGRFKLMKYCMKDALLPARLIGKLTMLIENIELARATGVPLDMICRRGLQIRLKSCLYREARYTEPYRHVFYTRTEADRRLYRGKYEGAYVHPPVLGYHDVPVVTLDFKSLYPSIMVTKGLCVSTLIPGRALASRKRKHGVQADDVWLAERNALPGQHEDQPVFVKSTRHMGLVPRILQALLRLRKRVKRQMADAEEAGNDHLAAIYDKRQLAIKLNCNSLYGVFGAGTSFAYCPEIAATVTATGRDMILETKDLVEATFTRANGYPFDAKVVYGDTDSVFVRLSSGVSIDESAKFGIEMAAFITKHFCTKYGDRDDNIIELEFEKSFSKIIFYAKKRYVGWKWEYKFDKDLDRKVMKRKDEPNASGMETERRDSCLLVSHGVRDVLAMLLHDKGTGAEALQRVQRYIWDVMLGPLEAGTVPWNLLIQSKQFRMRPAEYRAKGNAIPIHIQLAEKLEKRLGVGADGTYTPGDRIQFVVAEQTEPGQKTSECGESPNYAWQHRIPLSKQHYIENAVKKTMARILDPVLTGSNFITRDANSRKRDVTRMFEGFIRRGARQVKRMRTYRADPQEQTDNPKIPTRGLMRFVQSHTRRCTLCGVPTTAEDGICRNHNNAERQALQQQEAADLAGLERDRVGLWQACRACVAGFVAEDEPDRVAELPGLTPDIESLEQATPCKNATCKVYWERRRNDRLLGKE